MRPRWLGSVPPLMLLLAACGGSPSPGATGPTPETPSPFADCAALRASAPNQLPDLSLPCFTGGQEVALTSLPGPAVINLWASWCGPCREELPIMQELAEAVGDRLHVVGVDVGDSRESAASFGAAHGVSFPTLYDRDRRLSAALGKVNLPVTVFVDSAGKSYVHSLPMDFAELPALVRKHTGVTVPA